MPNHALEKQVIPLMPQASPGELVAPEMAAALIKQIDQDDEIEADTDQRIKLPPQEKDWIPGTLEVWNALVSPKRWEIPERLDLRRRKEK
jgi:hypothetical protein